MSQQILKQNTNPTLRTVEAELLDALRQLLAMCDRLGKLLPIVLANKAVRRAREVIERAEGRGAILALVLLSIHPVHAQTIQDSVERWAHVANVAGQAADAVSSVVAFQRGCSEGNAGLYGAHPSVGRIVWTKTAVVGGVYMAMRFAEKNGNRKIARVLGYFSGGYGTSAAVANSLNGCGGGR